MVENQKTLKQYCKEAKKRLKSGFWQNYQKGLSEEISRAEKTGISVSKVKEYYAKKVADDIRKPKDEFEDFYKKVKKLLDEEGEVSDAIAEDRRLMSGVREETDIVIDTANISSAQLRERIVSCVDEKSKMSVTVMSFGFKYGLPADADMVFDVRCFANPYYIESMKHHTGMEDEVYDFLFSFDEVHEFVGKLFDMLESLIPLYQREGKAQLSVAIGCTGGKHRSVAVARAVAERLRAWGQSCVEIHRDIGK
jgi:UPF0042 nucleotide-binding protein